MKKSAFSLIELSIVTVIIGILIVGITQASRMVRESRLTTARNQTKDSPVSTTSGLTLWLETTSVNSFKNEFQEEGSKPQYWYDINPQSVNKFEASQSLQDKRPIYLEEAVNNLPALKFDGSNDYYDIAYNSELNPKNFTIFSVSKVKSALNYSSVYSSRGVEGAVYGGYMLYARLSNWEAWYGIYATWDSPSKNVNGLELEKATVITTSFDGTRAKLYNNGSQKDSDVVGVYPNINTSNPFRIGAGAPESVDGDFFLDGYIAEIIIFNRSLKTEERQAVEKYLGKKWGVRIIS